MVYSLKVKGARIPGFQLFFLKSHSFKETQILATISDFDILIWRLKKKNQDTVSFLDFISSRSELTL